MAPLQPPDTKLDEVLGLLRYCVGCEEWWPSDEEFWRPNRWYRRAVCRACHAETRRQQTAEAARRYRARLREGRVA
jgi:hypothetical protein